uniref:Uncharacterized protein n=1 Tax=Anguilla anguilla TaxID=7936 RepID=A0A0E9VJ65_ANGAN
MLQFTEIVLMHPTQEIQSHVIIFLKAIRNKQRMKDVRLQI